MEAMKTCGFLQKSAMLSLPRGGARAPHADRARHCRGNPPMNASANTKDASEKRQKSAAAAITISCVRMDSLLVDVRRLAIPRRPDHADSN
jgi:hypothetical protein